MFSYLYDGIEHVDTSTNYCAKLGMNDETICSIQKDAAAHTESQWKAIRAERNRRIYAVEWRIGRMYREDQLGIPRTDNDKTMQALHSYIQALAELPEQFGTPEAVVWPVLNL